MAAPYFLPSTAKAGTIYLSKNLDTTKDIVVTFDYACYGSAPSGSEGFCVIFNNALSPFLSGGGPGAGLCYTPVFGISAVTETGPKDVFEGVFLGELGVGFDLTGNYSTSSFGVDGLVVGTPNTITIRGSQLNFYTRQYTSANLASSAFQTPISLYQQVTSFNDAKFSTIRVRLTDFCKKVIIDIKPPGSSKFINYVTQTFNVPWPPSVNCCLGFATGLIDTCFAVKNFNINGIFTDITGENIQALNFWTYCGAWYLGQDPNPQTFTVFDTLSVVNAPPWSSYPPLILVSPGAAAPFSNNDGYINILTTGTSACSIEFPGDDYFNRVGNLTPVAQQRIYDFITQLIAEDNIWSKIKEGWLLGSTYNKGSGNIVYALKNDINNGTIFTNSLDEGITWLPQGIRFHFNNPPGIESEVPRIQIVNWDDPNLSPPMGIITIASPYAFKSPGSSVFGRTSYGGGVGSHFGVNYGEVGDRFDCYHGLDAITGAVKWTLGSSPLSSWWFQGMTTDGTTVSAFMNGYTVPISQWVGSYTLTPGTVIDEVWFGNSAAGFQNAEFDGIIQAGFVLNEKIDLNKFYQIYKNTIGQGLNFPSYP